MAHKIKRRAQGNPELILAARTSSRLCSLEPGMGKRNQKVRNVFDCTNFNYCAIPPPPRHFQHRFKICRFNCWCVVLVKKLSHNLNSSLFFTPIANFLQSSSHVCCCVSKLRDLLSSLLAVVTQPSISFSIKYCGNQRAQEINSHNIQN